MVRVAEIARIVKSETRNADLVARYGGEELAVLLFDHRGFGASGGEPRHEINPWSQARGYRDALNLVHSRGRDLPPVRAGDLVAFTGAGVTVDDFLRTTNPRIYAAGDICEYDSPVHGKPMRIEHWDVAFNQGKTAAFNMMGRELDHDVVPYFFSDQPAITWQVNGQVNDTGKDITLRANGTGQGSATVNVSAASSPTSSTLTAAAATRRLTRMGPTSRSPASSVGRGWARPAGR